MTAPVSIPAIWPDLVARYGTPLAICDVAAVRAQCRRLKAAFSFCDLFYSVKANYSPALVRIIAGEGLGVDAVSPGEVELALRCGVAARDIVYVENNMSDAEMEFAASRGVRLAIGSLSRLRKYAARFPGASVGVRINADVGGAHHARAFTAGPQSKFGIHTTAIPEALAIAREAQVRIDLVQQHIGSGWLDEAIFAEAADMILREAGRFPDLETVDFGGGFGVPYKAGDHPLDLERMGAVLKARAEAFQAELGRRLRFALEPGRFLVAGSMALLARVQDKKTGSDGRVFLGLDAGFNQLMRPALYNSPHEIRNLSRPDGAPTQYDICGNICESTDFFARGRALPATEEGDVLAIMNYGAYGAAMGSVYNLRAPAAEVFVEGERHWLTRRRASLDDLLATFEPDH
jgi:diaminopimelate decarboxylase